MKDSNKNKAFGKFTQHENTILDFDDSEAHIFENFDLVINNRGELRNTFSGRNYLIAGFYTQESISGYMIPVATHIINSISN